MTMKKEFTLENYKDKLTELNNWKEKVPNEWNCMDYVSFMYNTGIADYYYKLYNCINDDGVSEGFRAPSIDISRAWAVKKKFFIHNCYTHKGEKHSVLDENKPTATWICPTSGTQTQIPHRHTAPRSYIPISFDLTDKEKGIFDILKLGYKARIWHYEMSTFKNIFRGEPTYPDGMKKHNVGEKWERVKSHNLMMEFDTTKVNGIRRDFMEEGDKVIKNAQKIIDIVNSEMDKRNISAYEWLFSGGGLYFIMDHRVNDENRKPEGINNLEYYNIMLKKWSDYQVNNIIPLLEKDKVMYIKLDDQLQFVRTYLKTPFSLHRKFDRLVLPLTAFFESNDKVDLLSSEWRKYIYPCNINRDFIESMTSKINI